MYVYLYKTTNRINDKYYIGIHKTNLDPLKHWDGYFGSGTLISRAINKYGKKAFDHQLLAIFGSREMACDAERAYIATCIDDPNCYNLAPGGEKGWNETLEGWRKRDPDAYDDYVKNASARASKSSLKNWKNPDYVKKTSNAIKLGWSDLQVRKRASINAKARCDTDEWRNLRKEIQTEKWKELEYRKHITDKAKLRGQDPKFKKKISEGVRKAPMSEKNLRDALNRCSIKIVRHSEMAKTRKTQKIFDTIKEAQLNRRRLETLLDLPHTPFTYVDLVSPQIQ